MTFIDIKIPDKDLNVAMLKVPGDLGLKQPIS